MTLLREINHEMEQKAGRNTFDEENNICTISENDKISQKTCENGKEAMLYKSHNETQCKTLTNITTENNADIKTEPC